MKFRSFKPATRKALGDRALDSPGMDISCEDTLSLTAILQKYGAPSVPNHVVTERLIFVSSRAALKAASSDDDSDLEDVGGTCVERVLCAVLFCSTWFSSAPRGFLLLHVVLFCSTWVSSAPRGSLLLHVDSSAPRGFLLLHMCSAFGVRCVALLFA